MPLGPGRLAVDLADDRLRLAVLGNGAEVTLAGRGPRVAHEQQAAGRSVGHFATLSVSAAASSRSARAWRSTSANAPASCAPETPYLPSMTKNGTP